MYERTIFENDTIINEAEVLNKFDQAIYDLHKELNGTTVWENEDPTASFAAQIVTISCERNVKYYEIKYVDYGSKGFVLSTGKIPAQNDTVLSVYNGTSYYRTLTFAQAEDGTVTIDFANGLSGTTGKPLACIPVSVTFYFM